MEFGETHDKLISERGPTSHHRNSTGPPLPHMWQNRIGEVDDAKEVDIEMF